MARTKYIQMDISLSDLRSVSQQGSVVTFVYNDAQCLTIAFKTQRAANDFYMDNDFYTDSHALANDVCLAEWSVV
jgi:hypothetical protein